MKRSEALDVIAEALFLAEDIPVTKGDVDAIRHLTLPRRLKTARTALEAMEAIGMIPPLRQVLEGKLELPTWEPENHHTNVIKLR